MPATEVLLFAACALTLASAAACAQATSPDQSKPREEAGAAGRPAETAPGSAPELKPAFRGRTAVCS